MSGDIPFEIGERGKNSPKIYTPREFDRRLEDGRIRRDSVAGFTSISLSHLKSGITPVDISIVPYGGTDTPNIFCALNNDVYQGIFGQQPSQYPGLEEVLKHNRVYGQLWAIDDMVIERGIKKGFTREQIYRDFSGEFKSASQGIARLGKKLEDRSLKDLQSGDINPLDIVALEDEEARRELELWSPGSKEDFPNVKDDLEVFFSGPQDVMQCVIEARQRKGIQIIYGDNAAFTSFIQSQNFKKDANQTSVQIHRPIPQRLITAVIPLGSYEQQEVPKLF
ncbi:MAG TPA: hypothetical protein VLF93_04285 [Candidatus Saccharimonadales bacterium]|nr:hypothetical protein [Candidatus Saccharimonadales bacterium]